MKREDIERLLVDYANDDISAEDRKFLEGLFETDAQLRQEAQEMLAAMQALNRLEESSAAGAAMDKSFYSMLQNAKKEQQPIKRRVVVINMSWLKAGAAVAACLLAFFGGRFTVAPVEVIKYQKVIVKEQAPTTSQAQETALRISPRVKTLPVANLSKKEPEQNNSLLAVQLRSVFVSERIDAIMQLATKPKLSDAELKMMRLSLSEDPNVNVRLTVLNTLRPLARQQSVQNVLISSLNQQGDIMVQSAILDMLIDARSKQAIPQMIALLDNKNTDVMVQNKIKGGIESFLY